MEAWLAYPQSKRYEFSATGGSVQRSRRAVDLATRFDRNRARSAAD